MHGRRMFVHRPLFISGSVQVKQGKYELSADLERDRERIRKALRCLLAIDPNASSDMIMHGVRDAIRQLEPVDAD